MRFVSAIAALAMLLALGCAGNGPMLTIPGSKLTSLDGRWSCSTGEVWEVRRVQDNVYLVDYPGNHSPLVLHIDGNSVAMSGSYIEEGGRERHDTMVTGNITGRIMNCSWTVVITQLTGPEPHDMDQIQTTITAEKL